MLTLYILQVGASFAVPHAADLNELERSVDVLQNYFHKVRPTNQREFASQQHRPEHRQCHPPTTNPPDQLGSTPQFVYIKDRNSDMYLQYKPDNDYQVVIEKYNSTNLYQWWYIILCCSDGFPQYYYNTATDWWKRVIAADGSFVSQIPPRIINILSSHMLIQDL